MRRKRKIDRQSVISQMTKEQEDKINFLLDGFDLDDQEKDKLKNSARRRVGYGGRQVLEDFGNEQMRKHEEKIKTSDCLLKGSGACVIASCISALLAKVTGMDLFATLSAATATSGVFTFVGSMIERIKARREVKKMDKIFKRWQNNAINDLPGMLAFCEANNLVVEFSPFDPLKVEHMYDFRQDRNKVIDPYDKKRIDMIRSQMEKQDEEME